MSVRLVLLLCLVSFEALGAKPQTLARLDQLYEEGQSFRGEALFGAQPERWVEVFRLWSELSSEERLFRELKWLRLLNRLNPVTKPQSIFRLATRALQGELGLLSDVDAIRTLGELGELVFSPGYLSGLSQEERDGLAQIGKSILRRVAAISPTSLNRLLTFDSFSLGTLRTLQTWVQNSVDQRESLLLFFDEWIEADVRAIEGQWDTLFRKIVKRGGIVVIAKEELRASYQHGGASQRVSQELSSAQSSEGERFNSGLKEYFLRLSRAGRLDSQLLDLFVERILRGAVSVRRDRWFEIIGDHPARSSGVALWVRRTRLRSPATHFRFDFLRLYPELLRVLPEDREAVRLELGYWLSAMEGFVDVIYRLTEEEKEDLYRALLTVSTSFQIEFPSSLAVALRPAVANALARALCELQFSKLD